MGVSHDGELEEPPWLEVECLWMPVAADSARAKHAYLLSCPGLPRCIWLARIRISFFMPSSIFTVNHRQSMCSRKTVSAERQEANCFLFSLSLSWLAAPLNSWSKFELQDIGTHWWESGKEPGAFGIAAGSSRHCPLPERLDSSPGNSCIDPTKILKVTLRHDFPPTPVRICRAYFNRYSTYQGCIIFCFSLKYTICVAHSSPLKKAVYINNHSFTSQSSWNQPIQQIIGIWFT